MSSPFTTGAASFIRRLPGTSLSFVSASSSAAAVNERMAISAPSTSPSVESLLQLLKAVRCQDPNVQRIHIYRKRLPAKYLTALFLALADNKFVLKVTLCKVAADDSVAWAIAKCFRRNQTILQLDMSRNNFSDETCKQMAAALCAVGAKSPLRRVNLERNRIGDEGVDALCQAIPHVPSFTGLKLGSNKFGLKGLRSIATLLRSKESSLQSLDLRCNHLGNKGTRIISDALEVNETLLYLYLNQNQLDNRAVERLAGALKLNGHLRTLDLQRNDFGDRGAAAFVRALGVNDSFVRLKIRHTAVSEHVRAELLELLLMNSYGPDLARRTKKAIAHFQDESLHADETESSEDTEKSECVICFDKMSNCALLPCQHCNCCLECGKRLTGCHMCRSEIVKVLQLEPGRTLLRTFC